MMTSELKKLDDDLRKLNLDLRELKVSNNWESLTFYVMSNDPKVPFDPSRTVSNLRGVYILSSGGELIRYPVVQKKCRRSYTDHGHRYDVMTFDYTISQSVFSGKYEVKIALSEVLGTERVMVSREDVDFK
jgi:hypothetical protein